MKVYFVRHGQSMTNLERRASGWAQCPLSDLGHQQASALEPVFRNIKFDRIYSSDLIRTIQTAQDAIPGCEPEQSALIREINVGCISGVLRTELQEKYGETYETALKTHGYEVFGGENDEAVYERVSQFMKDLEKLEGVDKVAVFGHEGTIHAMMEYVLKVKFDIHNLRIKNGSVSVLSFENGDWKFERFSYVPELD